ncbi:MAG TPA: HupE/UreJ family protein, partial [Steroidobacteraceae bacterium]
MPYLLIRFALVCAVALVSLCASPRLAAHDLPGKLTILMYVKPQDTQLIVLLRVPMEGLSEIEFPLRGQGYLDFERIDPALNDAAKVYVLDNMRFFANGSELAQPRLAKLQVAHAGDRSFQEFETALAHIHGPRPTNEEDIYWKQAFLDVLLTYDSVPSNARLSVDPNLERLGIETHTVLRFLPPNGPERAFNYIGDPGLIQLEPSWWYAFSRFVALGFEHILEGIDHLLFLFCLVIPARSVRSLIPVITAFTIAHSITLISSAFGFTPSALWFPSLIETLIALSIVYMAVENMLGAKLHRRWWIVFCFGLVHGFGFSFILADRMQFAGSHLLSALLAFNVGVELGQLLVLVIVVPLLRFAFARLSSEKVGIIVFSIIPAHSAWHWLTERGSELLQYRWEWPTFDA